MSSRTYWFYTLATGDICVEEGSQTYCRFSSRQVVSTSSVAPNVNTCPRILSFAVNGADRNIQVGTGERVVISITGSAGTAININPILRRVILVDGYLASTSGQISRTWNSPGTHTVYGQIAYKHPSGVGSITLRSATRKITVVAPNQNPTARFVISPSSPREGQTITFNAAGSEDTDGTIENYLWEIDGGDIYRSFSVPSYRLEGGLTVGVHTVDLTVTDNDGGKGYASSTVNVAGSEPENQAPTASFTFSPDSPTVGTELTFDASDSTDTDGSITKYEWDFGDDSEAGTGKEPKHTYGTAGTYDVKLTVTDDKGAKGTVTKKVVVGAAGSGEVTFTFKGSVGGEADRDLTPSTISLRSGDAIRITGTAKKGDQMLTGVWVDSDGTDVSGGSAVFDRPRIPKGITIFYRVMDGDTEVLSLPFTIQVVTTSGSEFTCSVQILDAEGVLVRNLFFDTNEVFVVNVVSCTQPAGTLQYRATLTSDEWSESVPSQELASDILFDRNLRFRSPGPRTVVLDVMARGGERGRETLATYRTSWVFSVETPEGRECTEDAHCRAYWDKDLCNFGSSCLPNGDCAAYNKDYLDCDSGICTNEGWSCQRDDAVQCGLTLAIRPLQGDQLCDGQEARMTATFTGTDGQGIDPEIAHAPVRLTTAGAPQEGLYELGAVNGQTGVFDNSRNSARRLRGVGQRTATITQSDLNDLNTVCQLTSEPLITYDVVACEDPAPPGGGGGGGGNGGGGSGGGGGSSTCQTDADCNGDLICRGGSCVAPDPNTPPEASFNFTPEVPFTEMDVAFDGTDSRDGDGNVTEWKWRFGDGTVDAGSVVSHDYKFAGAYEVTLTILDDDGAEDRAYHTVQVTDKGENRPPVINVKFPPRVLEGSEVIFNYSETGDPEEGFSQLTFRFDWESDGTWDFTATGGENPEAFVKTTFTGPGIHQVTVEVEDGLGANSTKALEVEVVSTDGGGIDAKFKYSPFIPRPGQEVFFDGRESSYSGHQLVNYSWDFGDGTVESGAEGSVFHTFSDNNSYTVVLTVTGDDGIRGRAQKIVRVLDTGIPNQPPIPAISVSPRTSFVNTVFKFDASGSRDFEDSLEQLRVRWDFNGDGNWDTEYERAKIRNHQYGSSGTYRPRVDVIDSFGSNVTAMTEVNVLRPGAGFLIDLRAGWNIVFLGRNDDVSVEDLMSFCGDVRGLRIVEGQLSPLTGTMDGGGTYLIRAPEACGIIQTGIPVVKNQITLFEGWNLVGWNERIPAQFLTDGCAENGNPQSVRLVSISETGGFVVPKGSDLIGGGAGYLVYIQKDVCRLTIN